MHILIAPQSLKGSLTAQEAGAAIAQGVRLIFPTASIEIVPIADGGEGTVQVLVEVTTGRYIQATVTGPLGKPVQASFGVLGDGHTVALEMASCAGLPLIPPEQRNPLITTTYGVGELIRLALDTGARNFIIGIGGSATNDGGAGMAQALGARLLTATGQEIAPGGAALATLARIDVTQMDNRLSACNFEVACDVSNPLYGPQGASSIYGPQKGATAEMIVELDTALQHYARILERDLHVSVADVPGAGAAGGLGAGLVAFLSATLRPGAPLILEALHFKERLSRTDLVITAEGLLDAQTTYGKSIGTLAQFATERAVPVLALAGGLGNDYTDVYESGVTALAPIIPRPMSLTEAMEHAASLLQDATARSLKLLKIGARLQERGLFER